MSPLEKIEQWDCVAKRATALARQWFEGDRRAVLDVVSTKPALASAVTVAIAYELPNLAMGIIDAMWFAEALVAMSNERNAA
jgi:hypothetical protein